MKKNHIKIKICGITCPRQAWECVEAGADALGVVLCIDSPRYVNMERARHIVQAVAGMAACVGVFSNEDPRVAADFACAIGIGTVQLHGVEKPQDVEFVKRRGLKVIKALFNNRKPSFDDAPLYPANGFLAESPGKHLPGGTGISWDWSRAKSHPWPAPLILAGGLNPDNIQDAIAMANPWGVDVSSGVEESPGIKDMDLVRRFIEKVRGEQPPLEIRRFL